MNQSGNKCQKPGSDKKGQWTPWETHHMGITLMWALKLTLFLVGDTVINGRNEGPRTRTFYLIFELKPAQSVY